MEAAIAAAWRRDNGDREQEVTSQINTNTGDVKVFLHMNVVEEVENEYTEVTLEEAKKINKKAEIGGTVETVYEPKDLWSRCCADCQAGYPPEAPRGREGSGPRRI